MKPLDQVFPRLQTSAFRRRFHLGVRERAYLSERGLDTVLKHARKFVAERLAPAAPANDGKQTPYRGHPVFVAQHATACCCRGCLQKWHGIPRGQPMSGAEQEHVVTTLERWLRGEAGREPMAIRIVRLGSPRQRGEGPRFAAVRRPPRGVRKEDYARLNYFDLWLPDLAPSAPLLSYARSQPLTPARWEAFSRRYRSEMGKPAARRWLATLALLSTQSDFSVGCYCADESRCHRSLLGKLLVDAGATVRQAD